MDNKYAPAIVATGLFGLLVFPGDGQAALGPKDCPATIIHVDLEFSAPDDSVKTIRGAKWKDAAVRKIVREINKYTSEQGNRLPWPWKFTDAPFVEREGHAELKVILRTREMPGSLNSNAVARNGRRRVLHASTRL